MHCLALRGAAATSGQPPHARVERLRNQCSTEAHHTKAISLVQVRVPVGFWLLANNAADAAPFVPNAYTYLDNAFKWGNKYGIAILIDMHAATQSQNGCVLLPFTQGDVHDCCMLS